MASTILITGAAGKTGRRIVERLDGTKHEVRIGSRGASPPFDWAERSTWSEALRGVDAAYVSFYPDLAAPGAGDAIQAFCRLAVASRVGRLVLLSGRGEEEAQRCEDMVRAAGVEWTILRASWFAQNFSEGYFLEPLLAGEVALPAGDVGEPFVDADDIAEVAVAASTEDGHAGELYELTGPRLLTFAQAVAEIGRAAGRDIRYLEMPAADYAAALAAAGLSRDLIALITYLFSEVLDGRNASLADGVQRALGRAPTDFGSYARAAAAAGVWSPGSTH
jgi:uncharacterized protein YbjT (DUF2867 family)